MLLNTPEDLLLAHINAWLREDLHSRQVLHIERETNTTTTTNLASHATKGAVDATPHPSCVSTTTTITTTKASAADPLYTGSSTKKQTPETELEDAALALALDESRKLEAQRQALLEQQRMEVEFLEVKERQKREEWEHKPAVEEAARQAKEREEAVRRAKELEEAARRAREAEEARQKELERQARERFLRQREKEQERERLREFFRSREIKAEDPQPWEPTVNRFVLRQALESQLLTASRNERHRMARSKAAIEALQTSSELTKSASSQTQAPVQALVVAIQKARDLSSLEDAAIARAVEESIVSEAARRIVEVKEREAEEQVRRRELLEERAGRMQWERLLELVGKVKKGFSAESVVDPIVEEMVKVWGTTLSGGWGEKRD